MTVPRHRFPLARGRLAGLLAAGLIAAGGVGHAAPSDDKATRYYEDALTRYERNDLKGAIIQLKNALQIDKSRLPVHVLLGKSLLANGEAGAAEVALNEALRLGVNRAEVIVPLAHAYVGQGKQKLLVEQAQFNPAGLPAGTRAQLLLVRAAAQADLGDTRTALRDIEEARSLDPRSAEAWLAEVPVRIRARQFREASDAVAKALTLAPNSVDGWYHKAAIAHAEGDLNAALAGYDKVVQLQAAHVEARIARAGLLMDLGRLPAAKADLAELQKLSPLEPRGAYMRSLLAEQAGDATASRAALREVTAFLDPVPADYLRFRPQLMILNGLAHFGLGEWEKAKPIFETYIRQHGQGTVAKPLAQIYLREGNAGLATDVLEAFLRGQPDDPQAVMLLASAQMALGRHAKASALVQDALRTRDTPELRTALGLALLGGGQTQEATAALEAAYARDPGQTQAGSSLVSLYLRRGDAPKALALAQALVRRQPGNASFQNLLGLSQMASGKAAEARASYEAALKLDPAQLTPALNLARIDMSSGAFDAAASRLGALHKAQEKNVDVLMELSELSRMRGQLADQQRWLEKAADHAGPRELRPGLALVDLHLRAGRAVAALDVAKLLLPKAPEAIPPQLAMARAQMATGDQAAARNTLTQASRLAGFQPQPLVDVAGLQLEANHPAGAAYTLDKALSGQPGYLPALAMLVEVDIRQGDLAKAEQRARQIVQREPRRAVGYGLLGEIAQQRSQPAAATAAFRQAHQVEPSTATLLRLLRSAHASDGPKAALAVGDQWLRSHPQDLAVRKAMADTHAAAGQDGPARAAYEAVLKQSPDDAEVLNNLANVLHRMKDPTALTVAERALAREPGNPLVIDTIGWISFQAGNDDRALQLLRDARLREPAHGEIRYHLAAVLAKVGRRAEARDELQAALSQPGSLLSRREAEALLQTLR
jgi:putative PEP-CTERM system TPR-repeat lipoprotein